MHNTLVSFLVENNYAPNETSALKILCCASDAFYDYLVCESEESNATQIAQLRRKIQDLMQRGQKEKARKLTIELAELMSQENERAAIHSAGKKALEQETQQSTREQAINTAGEAALRKLQGKPPKPQLSPQTRARLAQGQELQQQGRSQLEPGTYTLPYGASLARQPVTRGDGDEDEVSGTHTVAFGREGDTRARSQGGATLPAGRGTRDNMGKYPKDPS